MSTSSIFTKRTAKPLAALILALTLALAGCSGGEDQEEGGSAGGGSVADSSENTGASPRAAGGATGQTTEQTGAEESLAGDSAEQTTASGSGTTALSGMEEARREAEAVAPDAQLYSVVSSRPTVNAEGEASGWLYSFVSSSGGTLISVPFSGGEPQEAQEQELPDQQIEQISGDTLPVDELMDSPEALEQAGEVRSYLEENPEAGASFGVDSATSEEPQWIIQVPQAQLDERVPAAG